MEKLTFFEGWIFTKEEFEVVSTFTEMNLMYFKSLRYIVIQEQLNLIFDPTKAYEFVANRAALQGKIDVLTQLIGD